MKRGSKLKKRRGKTASQNSRELRLGRTQASSTIGTATVTGTQLREAVRETEPLGVFDARAVRDLYKAAPTP